MKFPNVPITSDPRTTVHMHQGLWHNDDNLEALLHHIITTASPARFVETGTHMGWASAWVAENYPKLPVFTVELDADFFVRSCENLIAYPNVKCFHDDSVNFLWKHFNEFNAGTSLFWLDAHWHPPVPLREECRIVNMLDSYICLIDDFNCWAPRFGGDTFYSRHSADYTKTGPDGGGDAYLNDLSYVASELGDCCYRPAYAPRPGNNGVGLFLKDCDYTPPATWRFETGAQFLVARDTPYPLHPSWHVSCI